MEKKGVNWWLQLIVAILTAVVTFLTSSCTKQLCSVRIPLGTRLSAKVEVIELSRMDVENAMLVSKRGKGIGFFAARGKLLNNRTIG